MKLDSEGRITLKEEQQKIIKSRITAAEDWANTCRKLNDADKGTTFKDESERNLALVRGTYWEKLNKADRIKQRNHIKGALAVKQTIMAGGETVFMGTPRRSMFTEQTETNIKLLNHQWDILGFDRECDAAAWDSEIHKRGGVVQVGWRYDDGNIEQDGIPPSDEEKQEQAEYQVLPEPLVDDPFVERFDPRDLLIDPNCTSYTLKGCRAVFRRKKETLAKIKANKRFKNTDELKGTHYGYWRQTNDELDPPDHLKEDLAIVTYYDGDILFDIDGNGKEQLLHVIMCDEHDKELLCEPTPYPWFRGDNPTRFEIMPAFVADNDSLDGVADVTACRDTQVGHDEAYTQIEYHRAHSPNVLGVPNTLLEGEDGPKFKRKIESGVENQVVGLNPGDSMTWNDPPPPNPDAYAAVEAAPNIIRDQIGVSQYETNTMPTKDVTATEANQLASQGSTRQEGEIDRYFGFVKRVAFKVAVLNQQFIGKDREFLFTDNEGGQQFGMANPNNLRGVVPGSVIPATNPLGTLEEPGIQFVLELDASKKLPKNEFSERQQTMELLAKLQPFAQMPDPRLPNRPLINLPPLLRGILDSYNLPNADEIIPPEPTPEEIQAFQIEQEMQMQAERQAQDEQVQADQQGKQQDAQNKMDLELTKAAMKQGGQM